MASSSEHCPYPGRITIIHSGDYTQIRYHYTEHLKIAEILQRACDKWPDAPPEVKWLADMITNGMPMQDYFLNSNLAGKVKPNQSDKQY